MGDMTIEVYKGDVKQMCRAVSDPPIFTITTHTCTQKLTGNRLRITLHKTENTTVQLRLCEVGVHGGMYDTSL